MYCNCTQVFNGVFLASSIKTNSEDVSIFEDLGVQGRTLVDIRAEILNPLACALEDFKSVLSEFKGVKFEMCEMATYTQINSDGSKPQHADMNELEQEMVINQEVFCLMQLISQ